MKPYRLLVDWEVIEQLNRLPIRVRRALRSDILQLRELPDAMSEFEEKDDTGRMLNVILRCGSAILYWIDVADLHLAVEGFVSHIDSESRTHVSYNINPGAC